MGHGMLEWSLHLWNWLYLNTVLWVCLWHHSESGKSTTTHIWNQRCLILRHWYTSGKRGQQHNFQQEAPPWSASRDKLNHDLWTAHNPLLIHFRTTPLPPTWDKDHTVRLKACHIITFCPLRTLLNFYYANI